MTNPPAKPGSAALLRSEPAFQNLFWGQVVSQLGDALYYLVFLFMVEKITGDPRMVGVAGAAQTLPFLLLSPLAGVVADRCDRRSVLLACDLVSGALLAALAALVALRPVSAWLLIVAGAVLASVNAFFAPAKSAAIPQLVPEEKRDAANALSLAAQNLMPAVGVALSGTVLGVLYAVSARYFFAAAIALNAVSFLVSAAFVRRLPPLPPGKGREKDGGWAALRAGLIYLRGEPVLKTLLYLTVLVQLSISPFMLVYVQVNRDWFGGGYGTLALSEVSFFAGVVACSLFIERLRITRPGLSFIGGTVGVGVAVALMAVSRSVWVFAFWNVAAGVAFPFVQLPITGYVQRQVPRAMQGRVNAALGMAELGVAPLSIGLGGLLLSAVGAAWTIVAMGAAMTLAGLLGLLSASFRAARVEPAALGAPD